MSRRRGPPKPQGAPKAKPRAYAPPLLTIRGGRGCYTALGYRSARIAEKDGRSPTGGGNRRHEYIDREKLQAQSREFRKDNGLYAGMLSRARSYVVGQGFGLRCQTEDPEWNAEVEARWGRWWRKGKPEVTEQLSGPRCERLAADELMTTGEVGVILTNRGQIQLVEAEQIKGPTQLDDGIARDEFGKPTRFYVSPYEGRAATARVAKTRPYDPKDFLYIASPERPSSSRAVPPCQASFPMLHRINDVCDSEAIAWQMQARIAILVNRQQGLPLPATLAKDDEDKSGSDSDGDLAGDWVTELDYALIFHGEPGDDVRGMERTSPGRDFPQSLTMFLRLLGLPLGLPLEITFLDWTKSNYSQSRAVLEQAYVAFRDWQEILEGGLHRPVFRWWLEREIRKGEIEARDDQDEHEWIKPTFPWIDQLKEAQAWGEKVDRGFATFSTVCKSLGSDRETAMAELERETVDAIEAAKRVKDATGVEVPWQPFAGRKAEGAATGNAATPPTDEAPTRDEQP